MSQEGGGGILNNQWLMGWGFRENFRVEHWRMTWRFYGWGACNFIILIHALQRGAGRENKEEGRDILMILQIGYVQMVQLHSFNISKVYATRFKLTTYTDGNLIHMSSFDDNSFYFARLCMSVCVVSCISFYCKCYTA